MKLRIGQPVHATDGLFGELGDIVIGPRRRTITDLVVEPHRQHYQARLVPISLVTEDDGVLRINLDLAHLRRLERVSYSEYLRLGESLDLGEDWDVGTADFLYPPLLSYEFDSGWQDDRVSVTYDRIPRGDVEIRRESRVVTADEHTVGHVEGLLSDDNEHITAVVVRVGVPGFRHDVLIPLPSVSKVRNDQIDLSIDQQQFDLLPSTDLLDNPDDALSQHIVDLQERAESLTAKFASRGGAIVAKVKNRIHHYRPPSTH